MKRSMLLAMTSATWGVLLLAGPAHAQITGDLDAGPYTNGLNRYPGWRSNYEGGPFWGSGLGTGYTREMDYPSSNWFLNGPAGGMGSLPNQKLPNQRLPNQRLQNQRLPNQPLQTQKLPNQPLPNQRLQNAPLPNQPLGHAPRRR